MRFNPPPNWPPSPPGWTPPPGWQPDPSWPPPPPGWQLWVSEDPVRSTRRRNGLIIGAVVAVLALAAAAVIAVVVLRSPSASTTHPTPPSAQQKTDEEQIKDAVAKFETAWNDRNFDGFKPILCTEMQADRQFNETDFLDARDESGRVKLSVESVEVDGDSATAKVSHDGEEPDDVSFVREDGAWKWCQP
jgi:hypothetical protein